MENRSLELENKLAMKGQSRSITLIRIGDETHAALNIIARDKLQPKSKLIEFVIDQHDPVGVKRAVLNPISGSLYDEVDSTMRREEAEEGNRQHHL